MLVDQLFVHSFESSSHSNFRPAPNTQSKKFMCFINWTEFSFQYIPEAIWTYSFAEFFRESIVATSSALGSFILSFKSRISLSMVFLWLFKEVRFKKFEKRFPVTSYNRNFIFWVTSYQREKWPLHTSARYTGLFILVRFTNSQNRVRVSLNKGKGNLQITGRVSYPNPNLWVSKTD